jgi:hypothetical protein
MTDIFTGIYRNNVWQSVESRSGNGSTLERTKIVRQELPALLERLGVDSLLDAPCGDMNWIATIDLPIDTYIGADVVPDLIAANTRRHADRQRRFLVADITRDDLPRCDAVLCRDCLIHLPNATVLATIRNLRRSGAAYLLATTHTTVEENQDIAAGEWRSINLQKPPFLLPDPQQMLVENQDTGKCLGIWRFEALGDI